MTERKRWPNQAEWARMDSIAAARRGLEAVRKTKTPDAGVLVTVVDALHQVIHNLAAVGPGKPDGPHGLSAM